MTLMIQLVGGQYFPNVLPVRHFHPEKVLLVYTDGTSKQYQHLKVFLESETAIEALKTDAYDIQSIRSQLSTAIQQFLSKDQFLTAAPELLFNLTGGTKGMALAAYQVALQYNIPIFYLESESGQTKVYCYSWVNSQPDLKSQELLPEYLSLRDVLDLHLGQGKDAEGKEIWNTRPNKDIGGLFEQAIAQVLDSHGYEVICGVKTHRNNLDIDIIIRYQNNVGIIEAKTDERKEKHPKLDGVKQLRTAVGSLRGTYTRQFLVINKLPSDSQGILIEASGITVIPLLHYHQGMSTLTAEDAETLLIAVDKNMKAGMARP